MIVNRNGKFRGRVIDHGVAETGQNKLATFVVNYELTEELGPDGWADLPQTMTIRGYHYVEKKDGGLNQTTIEQIKNAFRWDGRDLLWLQDTNLVGLQVQIDVSIETYDNKPSPKVKWLREYDADPSGGGVSRADAATMRALNNRLGARLRANAGGTPMLTAPARGIPALPAKAPSVAPSARTATADEAWNAFNASLDASDATKGFTAQARESEWWRIIAEIHGNKPVDQFTPADWGAVVERHRDMIVPF